MLCVSLVVQRRRRQVAQWTSTLYSTRRRWQWQCVTTRKKYFSNRPFRIGHKLCQFEQKINLIFPFVQTHVRARIHSFRCIDIIMQQFIRWKTNVTYLTFGRTSGEREREGGFLTKPPFIRFGNIIIKCISGGCCLTKTKKTGRIRWT